MSSRDAEGKPIRRRDSAATREAFLSAASTLFAERGFDKTTVRDIAGLAGANQALLFRYFGSKEALFDAAVARSARDWLAETPIDELLDSLLRGILGLNADARPGDAMGVLLSPAERKSARADLRSQLGKEYIDALAALSVAHDANLRAHLVLAWMIGIGVVRRVTGDEPLSSADPEAVRALFAQAADVLLRRLTEASSSVPDHDVAS